MANLFDYLDWRGDISFETDPFNEVDNAILSWLAYIDFEEVIPASGEWMTIEEVNRAYFRLHTEEELRARETFTKTAPFLLPKIAESRRFANLRLSAYVNLIDAERVLQMSALLYEVGDGTYYAAFRGTDSTLIGWKEDFDLSYAKETEGQAFARKYLETYCSRPGMRVRVGGHSKGGNFAVYASVFCNDATRGNIIEVYSNDGPGFVDSVADSERFKSMLPRMIKIIPESSIVGILMSGHVRPRIIQSSESGVMQHDATSWEVVRNHFLAAEERSEESVLFDRTIQEWLDGIDSENRKLFIDNLFGLFDAAGLTMVEELGEMRIRSAVGMLKGFNALPDDHKKQFTAIIRKLVKSGVKVLAEREVKPPIPAIGERLQAVREEGAALTEKIQGLARRDKRSRGEQEEAPPCQEGEETCGET